MSKGLVFEIFTTNSRNLQGSWRTKIVLVKFNENSLRIDWEIDEKHELQVNVMVTTVIILFLAAKQITYIENEIGV